MMQKNMLPPSSVLKMDKAATSATLIPPTKLHGFFSFADYFNNTLSIDHIAMNATSRMINEWEGTVVKSTYYAAMPGGLSKTTRTLSPDSQCPGRDLN
jgi:hypothetical protein